MAERVSREGGRRRVGVRPWLGEDYTVYARFDSFFCVLHSEKEKKEDRENVQLHAAPSTSGPSQFSIYLPVPG